MFVNLRNDTKIYAVSAANPSESSWATYCYPNDEINGIHIDSCLGDLFSVNWMEDSETGLELSETLQKQFEKVRYETELSNVMQWGDLSITSEPIGNFLGPRDGSITWL
jgi:legumain